MIVFWHAKAQGVCLEGYHKFALFYHRADYWVWIVFFTLVILGYPGLYQYEVGQCDIKTKKHHQEHTTYSTQDYLLSYVLWEDPSPTYYFLRL